MYQNRETSFYDLLEVTPDADANQILMAYQRAKEIYSPNSPALYSMFTEDEARELLKLLDEAYSTLSNRSRKKAYDLKMGFVTEPAPVETPRVTAGYEPMIKTMEKNVAKGDDAWSGTIRIHKFVQTPLEPGQAKTRFGAYTVEPQFEADIAAVEECDGSFLEKIRNYKNVSLEQLSEAMKVSKGTIKALEQNNLDKLPVEVFTRGIVIQVAKMLNLDEQKVAKAYMTYYRAKVTKKP